MRLGINLPFSGPAHTMNNSLPDFGAGPAGVPHWKQSRGNEPNLRQDLARMAHAGIRVVRWFILSHGGAALGMPNYAPNPSSSRQIPTNANNGMNEVHNAATHWTFEMPSREECAVIVDDFMEMLGIVQSYNRANPANCIQILPVWTDFRMFFGCGFYYSDSIGEGGPEWASALVNKALDRLDSYDYEVAYSRFRQSGSREANSLTANGGGRIDIIITPSVRAAFYCNLVIPLLERVHATAGARDCIYAWDIGNELDMWLGSVSLQDGWAGVRATCSPTLLPLLRFLSEMIRIHHGQSATIQSGSSHRVIPAIGGLSATPFLTTVGWLRCGVDFGTHRGLTDSILDRRFIKQQLTDIGTPVNSEASVEDLLQFHAYIASHPDQLDTPSRTQGQLAVQYVRCNSTPVNLDLQGRNLNLFPTSSTSAVLPWPYRSGSDQSRIDFFNAVHLSFSGPVSNPRYQTARTLSGWRCWPNASALLAYAAWSPQLHEHPRQCIIGEMAISRFVHGRFDYWVRTFSNQVDCPRHYPQPSDSDRRVYFRLSQMRLDVSQQRLISHGQVTSWVYRSEEDNVFGRLVQFEGQGYALALPWSWNMDDGTVAGLNSMGELGPMSMSASVYWNTIVVPRLREFTSLSRPMSSQG